MDTCIFCKIIKKEIPAEIVFENGNVIAFKDAKPSAPLHVLVIPKKHIDKLATVSEEDRDLLGEIQVIIPKIAEELGILEGFKVTTNNGESAGQVVFHLHYHLQGGWK